MRHRLAILLAVSVVLLAGCANPGGVDGNLTDKWAAISTPSGFTPASGTCHQGNFAVIGMRAAYEEVDCGLRHRTETVFVGTYPSSAVNADDPATAREAYRTCDTKTTEFVGAQWRTGRLWIGVSHPSAMAWSGGARWFRCDVLEIGSIEDDDGLVQRIGSLKGALQQAASPLLLGCYAVQMNSSGAIGNMPAVTCAGDHNAEFVGVWTTPATAMYPKTDAQWAVFHAGCRRLIATYVGVPQDADLQYRAGVVSLPGGEDVWAMGDRGVRCYLWLDDTTLTTSLKGKGVTGLPIQYK